MERLASPNGVEVEARDDAVERLLSMGFRRFVVEKPKPAPKRAARKKEK